MQIDPANSTCIVQHPENLGQLAAAINAEHAAAGMAVRSGLEHARKAGELLRRAKKLCEHGSWLTWLETNCPNIGARQCQRYMRLAEKWPELSVANASPGTHLGIGEAMAMLAEPTPEASTNLLQDMAERYPLPSVVNELLDSGACIALVNVKDVGAGFVELIRPDHDARYTHVAYVSEVEVQFSKRAMRNELTGYILARWGLTDLAVFDWHPLNVSWKGSYSPWLEDMPQWWQKGELVKSASCSEVAEAGGRRVTEEQEHEAFERDAIAEFGGG